MVVLNMEQDMEVLSKLTEDQKVAFMRRFRGWPAPTDIWTKTNWPLSAAWLGFTAFPTSVSTKSLKLTATEEVVNAVKVIDNRRAALELIKEMCVLAHADDELSDQETLLIGRVGQAMGVELEKIEQISNWIIDRIIWLEQAKIIFEEVK